MPLCKCSVHGCNTFIDPVSGRPGRSLHPRKLKAHGVAQALAAAQTTLAAAQIPSIRHKAHADAAAAVDAQLEVITAHLASQTLGDKIATTSSSVHSPLTDQEPATATEAQMEDITAQLASQTLADNVSGPSGNPLWSRDVSQDPKANSSLFAPNPGATSHKTLSPNSTSISTPSTPSQTHEDEVIRAQPSVDSLPRSTSRRSREDELIRTLSSDIEPAVEKLLQETHRRIESLRSPSFEGPPTPFPLSSLRERAAHLRGQSDLVQRPSQAVLSIKESILSKLQRIDHKLKKAEKSWTETLAHIRARKTPSHGVPHNTCTLCLFVLLLNY